MNTYIYTSFKIIIFVSLLLLSASITYAQPNHYVIVGHIYPPYISDHVTLTNQATNEELTVQTRDCDHTLKEYLFELANLKQGWHDGDKFVVSYGNKSMELIIDTSMAGIQADFNRPPIIAPEPIIAGAILILALGASYYYIKRRKR